MSNNRQWECADCHAVLQAERTFTRHWKMAQEAGKGHVGERRFILRDGSLPAPPVPPPVPVTASLAFASPLVPSDIFSGLPSLSSLPPSPSPSLSPPPPPSPPAPPLSPLPPPVSFSCLPLRSSRSTRNQDHQAAGRNRPGVVDLDPTEGLPVQRWDRSRVLVNQDPSTEPSVNNNVPTGTTATSSAEWAAQFNTESFPWSEKPLPSFFSQLPPWNQEMIRRSRAGNTNPTLSVWDNKTSSWISGADAEKQSNPLKSVHLNNLHQSNGSKQGATSGSPVHDDEDDHEDKSDDEADADNAEDDGGPTAKKRKKYVPEERTFEVRQWKQVPSVVADRTEERKFLADRRPGMPSLYGGAYQNQVFGSMGLNTNGYGFSAANAGYDLGDGSALGNAGVVLGTTEEAVAPVRKNMPPRRKKKKGGPGRKKANPNPALQAGTNAGLGTAAGEQTQNGDPGSQQTGDATTADGDHDVSDSGSEDEGSEEGEIDEGDHDQTTHIGAPEAQVETAQVETAQDIQPALHISSVNDHQIASDMEHVDINAVETGMATDHPVADNRHSEHHTGIATPDVIMQDEVVITADQPAADVAPVTQLESEGILSVIQPQPHEEQVPDVPPVSDPVPVQQPVSTSEVQSIIPPEPQPDPQPQLEQPPQLDQQSLAEKPVDTDLPMPEEPTGGATAIPGLDAIPVEPATQLPPITTAVAEAMGQPSISAPGVSDLTATVSTAAGAPSVPEPTSPDLLGGLEDALNKNMDEQGGE